MARAVDERPQVAQLHDHRRRPVRRLSARSDVRASVDVRAHQERGELAQQQREPEPHLPEEHHQQSTNRHRSSRLFRCIVSHLRVASRFFPLVVAQAQKCQVLLPIPRGQRDEPGRANRLFRKKFLLIFLTILLIIQQN